MCVCVYIFSFLFFLLSFLPTVTDGVICLVEPSATTELLAVVSTPYSRDFTKCSSLKYTKKEFSSSSSQDDDIDEDTLSAATERDPERPTGGIHLNIMYGSY